MKTIMWFSGLLSGLQALGENPLRALFAVCGAASGLVLAGCVTVSDGKHLASKPDLHTASQINTNMGVEYFKTGQVARAIDKLKRAIEEDPNNSDAHSALAVIYAQRGETDLADSEYRSALSLKEDSPELRNNYGSFLCGQGKYDEGRRYLAQAAKSRDYTTPEAALTNLGVCEQRAGNLDAAESAFREAVRVNPDFASALLPLAKIVYQKQDYVRAKIFLDHYRKIARESSASLWLAAQIEAKQGNEEQAQAMLRDLVQKFPASDEAALATQPNSK